MRIQHNIMAMNSYRNYTNNVAAMKKNLEKLSSGYKINRAGDDAAGLAISEKMRAQITGLETAQKNAKDGISLVQTAEGALTEVHDMLNRMVELATQSANGTYDNETDRFQLQKEVNQLRDEINRIADSANFNGIKLLDGSMSAEGTSASLAEVDLSKLSGDLAGANKTIDAVKGVYENMAVFAANTNVAEGDKITVSYTLKDANGKVQNIDLTLTAAKDAAGDVKKLVAEDGSEYALTAADKASAADLEAAFITELNKNSTIKENFTVAQGSAAGQIALTAKTGGTQAMQMVGFEMKTWAKATDTTTVVSNGASVKTAAADAFESIDLSKGKIWMSDDASKGSDDLSKCVFEINGEKFVFVEKGKIDADSLAKLKEAGVEHYVEVGTASTIGNGDAKAMGEKISMETGLSVETGTVTTTNGVNTWAKGASTTIGLKSRSTAGSSKGGLVLQIGDTSDSYNQLRVSISDMHTKSLGIAGVDISNQDSAADAIDAIKKAINKVSDVRGTLGATQNRLDHTINNLSVMTENIQDAESTIRDTDVAEEMMAYTKNNILIQSAQAMLAQANQVPQGVLQLLQ
ncbi:MAG: flagellin [Oscillospiraceae bacterium]|jgi:flagellin|nr:flagellin [Oscillospiraceae bacterium]